MCRDYDILRYISASFFLIGLLFTIIYQRIYSKQSVYHEFNPSLPLLSPALRQKIGVKITALLVYNLIELAVFTILTF